MATTQGTESTYELATKQAYGSIVKDLVRELKELTVQAQAIREKRGYIVAALEAVENLRQQGNGSAVDAFVRKSFSVHEVPDANGYDKADAARVDGLLARLIRSEVAVEPEPPIPAGPSITEDSVPKRKRRPTHKRKHTHPRMQCMGALVLYAWQKQKNPKYVADIVNFCWEKRPEGFKRKKRDMYALISSTTSNLKKRGLLDSYPSVDGSVRSRYKCSDAGYAVKVDTKKWTFHVPH